ncbi:Chemotaxis protein CheW [Anaerobiospirillum thomasii]|uniref:Chemotaxis protein CheW n=2 Tax=Anaerobiospirillum thomasii TaxID=179995 RepID=A0A2X0VAE4_9GAMM|nr:Chemotaxis protein CheW [Anaerobiospirillum thomasii]SPT71464.1 Chemotaxis protein CheW [Anaerobiospirillum thomasii]
MAEEKEMTSGPIVLNGEKQGELLRWVTFQLDKEIYGVNVMQVREVLRYSDIAPVPGAPSYVLGIINLRGNVVTVIDTRMRFGLPAAEVSDNTRIMIIESEKQVIGILVDSVAEVVDLNTADIDDTPNVGTEESAKFIRGVCNRNEDLLILIDLNKLLTDEEWHEVANL